MKTGIWQNRIRFFLLGVAATLLAVMTMGADNGRAPQALANGRYQVSAWAGQFSKNSGGMGAFVIDTVSGETKIVYSRLFGDTPNNRVVINNLKKPFASMD